MGERNMVGFITAIADDDFLIETLEGDSGTPTQVAVEFTEDGPDGIHRASVDGAALRRL